MPPKADKKDKIVAVKGAGAEEMVLAYMRETNRPYSSTDVHNNLKKAVSKPEAQKAMTALAEKGLLTLKPYGKQTIFVYNQSQLDTLDTEAVAELDKNVKAAKSSFDEKRKELSELQSKITQQEHLPVTADLTKSIQDATAKNDLLLQSLGSLRGEASCTPMTSEQMAAIDGEWDKWKKIWQDGKKVYKNLLGVMSDTPVFTTRDEFEETVGVEQDDEATVEVEKGEFFQPAPAVPRSRQQKVGGSGHSNVTGGLAQTAASKKRAAPTATGNSKRAKA